MIWKTDCSHCKTLLALWVGNDLDEAGQQLARAHLEHCPCCRETLQQLQAGQQLLGQVRCGCRLEHGAEPSLWPQVALRLAAQAPSRTPPLSRRFAAHANRWLPTGALVAACLVIIVAIDNAARQQPAASSGSHASYVSQPRGSSPVNWPGWQSRTAGAADFQPRMHNWPRDEKLTFPPEQSKILPMEPYDPSSF